MSARGGNDGSLLYQLSTDKAVVVLSGTETKTDGFYCEKTKIKNAVEGKEHYSFIMYAVGVSGGDFDENGMCHDGRIVDLARAMGDDGASVEPVAVNATIGRDDSFEEILSRNGINISTFWTIRYVFYMTEDGVRFWNTWAGDTFDFPSGEWTNPARLPQVIPETLDEGKPVFISSSEGLSLREGPSTDYDEILIVLGDKVISTYPGVENGIRYVNYFTALKAYAEQDGWYYTKYLGRYGWIDGRYCSEHP